jgi:hypothetical protein
LATLQEPRPLVAVTRRRRVRSGGRVTTPARDTERCRLLPFCVCERADLRGVGRRERYSAQAVSERANVDGRPTPSHVACRCNGLRLWIECRGGHGVSPFLCVNVCVQVGELACGAIGASPDAPSVSGGGSPMARPTA